MSEAPAGFVPAVGLCSVCRCARIITSRRGSRFYLCERSRTDPAYPQYPRLPVLRCAGFELPHARVNAPDGGS